MRKPLYELALSARIALPGEFEGKAPAKKPKANARAKAAALRPPGKQRYLPVGEHVDEVLLVGGGTHMVAVRKLVSTLFGIDPRRTVDPMQAVALGAAVHAAVLSGELRGGRVLQAWQAKLGGMMSRDGGAGSSDEDEDAAIEDEDAAIAEFYRQRKDSYT